MWSRARLGAVAEDPLRPFDHPTDRPYPKSWSAATLTPKERAHVCQDGIGKVEYRLEWPETKCSDREGSGKPFGAR
jgi:hypothetical protein